MADRFTLDVQDARAAAPNGPVRALTLWQPWAWLVANGHKDVENRPRGFSFKSFRGEFWIHAGQHSDTLGRARDLAAMRGVGIPILNGPEHFGCIIGRAEIYGIVPPGDSGHFWHFPEQYGFLVRNARPVTPVPCRGYQGFWNVPPDVLAKLSPSTAEGMRGGRRS